MNWLQTLPKTILVFIVLMGGVLFIIVSDPPKTVCDVQMKHYKKNYDEILFEKKSLKNLDRLLDQCKAANSAGGCNELFYQTRQVVFLLKKLTLDCVDKVKSMSKIKKHLQATLELLVEISLNSKIGRANSWLESPELSLYCEIKDLYAFVYGKDQWLRFQNKVLNSFAKEKQKTTTEIWQNTLMSRACNS